MRGEIEDYLEAFGEAEALADSLNRMTDDIQATVGSLRREIEGTEALVPSNWPSAEQLRDILLQFRSAKARARTCFDGIRPDRRLGLDGPELIGVRGRRTSIPEAMP